MQASNAFQSRYEVPRNRYSPNSSSVRSSIRSNAFQNGLSRSESGSSSGSTLSQLLSKINRNPSSSSSLARSGSSQNNENSPDSAQATKGFTQKLKPPSTLETPECLMGGTDCKDSATKPPTFPEMKFITESSWDSTKNGGYIATLWVPIYEDTEDWQVRLVFNEPISQGKNWQFEPEMQDSSDNRTLTFRPKPWNMNLYKGNMLKIRYMLEYNKNEEANNVQNYSPRPVVHFQDRNFDFHEDESFLGASASENGSTSTGRSGITITKKFDKNTALSQAHLVPEKREKSACELKREADIKKCSGKDLVKESCFITKCDEITGDFIPYQCWARLKICWCMDKNGKKMSETIKREDLFEKSVCEMPKVRGTFSSYGQVPAPAPQRPVPQLPRAVTSLSTVSPVRTGSSRTTNARLKELLANSRASLSRTHSYTSPNLNFSGPRPSRTFSQSYASPDFRQDSGSTNDRLRGLILKMNDVTGGSFKSKPNSLGLKGNFRAGSFAVFGGRK